MSLILLSSVLLLIVCKPTADAEGNILLRARNSTLTGIFLQSFIQVYKKLNEVYNECDGDEDMINPAQACLMIVDWTDPQKAV